LQDILCRRHIEGASGARRRSNAALYVLNGLLPELRQPSLISALSR
jgi:hypothetical protein